MPKIDLSSSKGWGVSEPTQYNESTKKIDLSSSKGWAQTSQIDEGIKTKKIDLNSNNQWNNSPIDTQSEANKKAVNMKNDYQWQQSSMPTQSSGHEEHVKTSNDVQWQPIFGIQSPKIIRQFNGLNMLDAFSINEGQATDILNFVSDAYPAMKTRDGYTLKGNSLASVAGTETDRILGIMDWKGSTLIVAAGNGMYKYDDATASWIKLGTMDSGTELWSYCNFKGNFSDVVAVMANGVDYPKMFDGKALTDLPGGPINLNYICTHDNRLYGAVGSSIRFSALRKGDDWTTVNDAGEIVVETSDGKDITGLVAGPGHLVAFKEKTIWELYGTNPSNYKMVNVSEKVGCPAGHTAVMVNGLLYFLSDDGIYQYSGGNVPSNEFSLSVQKLIKTINKDYVYRSVAGTDGIKYYLAIPTGTNIFPDTLIVYDTRFGTFEVWKYINKLTSAFTVIDGTLYGGFENGDVIEFGGPDDDGRIISFHWESKPFTFDTLSAKNRWYRLWLVADVPTGSSLDIYLSNTEEGDDNWLKVNSITSDTNIQSQQIIIPVGLIQDSNWIRVKLAGFGPVTIYELTRQERVFPFGMG